MVHCYYRIHKEDDNRFKCDYNHRGLLLYSYNHKKQNKCNHNHQCIEGHYMLIASVDSVTTRIS